MLAKNTEPAPILSNWQRPVVIMTLKNFLVAELETYEIVYHPKLLMLQSLIYFVILVYSSLLAFQYVLLVSGLHIHKVCGGVSKNSRATKYESIN